VPSILIEEDSGREARRFFFRLNLPKPLNLVELKVRCEPLSLFFGCLIFDGTTSVRPLGVLVPSILIEEDSGREARRVIFRLNPKP
jgi:hypothetical protein